VVGENGGERNSGAGAKSGGGEEKEEGQRFHGAEG
jgi:hypothetical protein